MNQKKKTIVLWGVIIVLAAAVVALSVILGQKVGKIMIRTDRRMPEQKL